MSQQFLRISRLPESFTSRKPRPRKTSQARSTLKEIAPMNERRTAHAHLYDSWQSPKKGRDVLLPPCVFSRATVTLD